MSFAKNRITEVYVHSKQWSTISTETYLHIFSSVQHISVSKWIEILSQKHFCSDNLFSAALNLLHAMCHLLGFAHFILLSNVWVVSFYLTCKLISYENSYTVEQVPTSASRNSSWVKDTWCMFFFKLLFLFLNAENKI